ncbi:hypothetical protein K0M31_004064 [Melipona bicolor]|uniref:Uncharacterized protein n=1 Tax=Melipona bicolor TaxID=60889 RepID=A0AA40KP78_9HYME|nr:hypothetical protein K0M31_004064 [Melipona bicolor]
MGRDAIIVRDARRSMRRECWNRETTNDERITTLKSRLWKNWEIKFSWKLPRVAREDVQRVVPLSRGSLQCTPGPRKRVRESYAARSEKSASRRKEKGRKCPGGREIGGKNIEREGQRRVVTVEQRELTRPAAKVSAIEPPAFRRSVIYDRAACKFHLASRNGLEKQRNEPAYSDEKAAYDSVSVHFAGTAVYERQ